MRKNFRALYALLTLSALGACSLKSLDGSFDESQSCLTTRVKDGDSVLAVCDGKDVELRLICIDAPELSQKRYGAQAKKALILALGDQFAAGFEDEDRYGRKLATLWRGSQEVNLQMVLAGNALVYRAYCDQSSYLAAEAEAQRYQRGVWDGRESFIPPWQWRRR